MIFQELGEGRNANKEAIAVAERQSYIGRIRDLTRMCAEAWVANEAASTPAGEV